MLQDHNIDCCSLSSKLLTLYLDVKNQFISQTKYNQELEKILNNSNCKELITYITQKQISQEYFDVFVELLLTTNYYFGLQDLEVAIENKNLTFLQYIEFLAQEISLAKILSLKDDQVIDGLNELLIIRKITKDNEYFENNKEIIFNQTVQKKIIEGIKNMTYSIKKKYEVNTQLFEAIKKYDEKEIQNLIANENADIIGQVAGGETIMSRLIKDKVDLANYDKAFKIALKYGINCNDEKESKNALVQNLALKIASTYSSNFVDKEKLKNILYQIEEIIDQTSNENNILMDETHLPDYHRKQSGTSTTSYSSYVSEENSLLENGKEDSHKFSIFLLSDNSEDNSFSDENSILGNEKEDSRKFSIPFIDPDTLSAFNFGKEEDIPAIEEEEEGIEEEDLILPYLKSLFVDSLKPKDDQIGEYSIALLSEGEFLPA